MAAPLQTSSIDNTGTGTGTRTISLTGVTAGSTLVAWAFTFRYDTSATHISGVSSSASGAFTLAKTRMVNSVSGSGGFRYAIHCYYKTNVAAGSHTITATFANSTDNVVCWFVSEIPGITTVSPVDIAIDNSVAYGPASISIGPSANLAQAQEFAMVAFMGHGTEIWNGASSGNGNPPSGWTAWRSFYTSTGSPPPGMPFVAYYRDTTTTSPLSASVTVMTDSLAEPFLMALVTLKQTAGTYYVEVLLSPQAGITVNGSTGWTVEMSTGSPSAGATIVTGLAAQSSGNELRPAPPAGATLGQTINVVAYNTTLSHSGGTGVGTTRGTGIVKAG